MITIKNKEGVTLIKIPEQNLPLDIELQNPLIKKFYKLLITKAKKLILN